MNETYENNFIKMPKAFLSKTHFMCIYDPSNSMRDEKNAIYI